MRRVQVTGVELAVEDRGVGPPLVLLHGYPLDHAMWSAQVETLAKRHRVLAPDLRGFGRSGVTPGKVAMAQLAKDLAVMLDTLEVEGPVSVCGLSMGGYVAFAFWEQFRQRLRSLVLCDTRAKPDTPQAAADRRKTADRVEGEGVGLLADSMLPKLLSRTTWESRPELVDSLRQMILRAPPEGVAAAARGMAERPDMTGRLGEIRCPVLVVVGADDAISPPEEMRSLAAAIPGSRVVEIPGAGHMSPMEQPEAVSRAIGEFL
jgi:3-oxoadipate enol-lactonase